MIKMPLCTFIGIMTFLACDHVSANVEPPVNSPRFLTLPFNNTDIRITTGWYYSIGDNFQPITTCSYKNDLHGGNKNHCGIDYARGGKSFDVLAAAPGQAQQRGGIDDPNGFYVVINHDERFPDGTRALTIYAHLKEGSIPTSVPRIGSDHVVRGQKIGEAGNTGRSDGIHLHFAVGTVDSRIDPYDIAGTLLGRIPPVEPDADHYPNSDTDGRRNRFSDCGRDNLWIDCRGFALYNSLNAHEIPQSYGVPYDVFSAREEVLFRPSVHRNIVTIEAGTGNPYQYIYEIGYEWRGGKWQPFSFSGESPAPGWIRGSGEAVLPRTFTDSALAEDNFLVGYLCMWRQDLQEWKCGCRDETCDQTFWQLQGFKRR